MARSKIEISPYLQELFIVFLSVHLVRPLYSYNFLNPLCLVSFAYNINLARPYSPLRAGCLNPELLPRRYSLPGEVGDGLFNFFLQLCQSAQQRPRHRQCREDL